MPIPNSGAGTLIAMSRTPTKFPFIEGVGVFIGVLGWDLLSEGHLEIGRALMIAVPFTLVWFALRYWRQNKSKWGK